jgi:hypothetical protein
LARRAPICAILSAFTTSCYGEDGYDSSDSELEFTLSSKNALTLLQKTLFKNAFPDEEPPKPGPRKLVQGKLSRFNSMEMGDYSHVSCVHANDRIVLKYSNPIDSSGVDGCVSIDPPLPDGQIEIADRQIILTGTKELGKHYTITVSNQLRDIYGQTAGASRTVEFQVDFLV